MKRVFVDTPAGQIHCRTEGNGEPLLLLHQVPSSSSEFSDVIPILGQQFRVLAMDLPLFGDSYKTTGEPEVEDMAQAVIDFLNALRIKKTHIAGHHTGACVAVELSVGHPERVQKLILSACPSWTSEEGLKWLNSSLYRKLEVTPDGWFMQYIWDFVIQRIPQDRMDKAYDFALDYMKTGSRAEAGHRAAFRYDTLSKLKKIRQPTLAV